MLKTGSNRKNLIVLPDFAESEKAISNLGDREKGKNIGKDWTRWWFKKNDQKRSITNSRNRKSLVKLVIFSALSILLVASFAKYSYDQLHDYGNILYVGHIMFINTM